MKKYLIVLTCCLFIYNPTVVTEQCNNLRRTRNGLDIELEELIDYLLYNKQNLISVFNLIKQKLDGKKPLVVLIDGDSRVGKTSLALDIARFLKPDNVTVKTVHMDDFLSLEQVSPDYAAYAEQFGSTLNFDTMTGLFDSWDYKEAARTVLEIAATGDFDVVILEGLNSGWLDILDDVKFDIKIHITASQATRELIYKLTFPEQKAQMEKYLRRYTTQYGLERIGYDLILDNSLTESEIREKSPD
ncbi:MAG: hypothetical protein PHQ54_05230 [Candidatus Omnitrophica bacterium]|nr:hypothetical protein [Candidatus Omnitrophota bacterium]